MKFVYKVVCSECPWPQREIQKELHCRDLPSSHSPPNPRPTPSISRGLGIRAFQDYLIIEDFQNTSLFFFSVVIVN